MAPAVFEQNIFEPRRQKTELRDSRPTPTQTGLYSLREVLDLKRREIV